MKESELAQKFVDYLSCYDLYFEVDYAGHSIDIVAIAEKLIMAVEVKTSFNFKVLEQALANKPYFNYSYVAVPEFNDWFMQKKLCEDYGIGMLIYDAQNGYNDVREIVAPKLNRVSNKLLLSRLHPFNKKSKAGSKSGDTGRITAFQITVENMLNYVFRHPGCTIKEMVAEISHHYNSNKAACANTYAWIYKGVITEIELRNGKLYLTETGKKLCLS